MKKNIWVLLGMLLIFTACSNEQENIAEYDSAAVDSTEESVGQSEAEMNNAESSDSGGRETAESGSSERSEEAANEEEDIESENRKIIYTANLQVEVKDYEQSVDDIESYVADFNGYIIEASTYGSSEDSTTNGHLTARIPQERFQAFIQQVEEGTGKLLESNVSGQDVTEEYVDLESRLKSKRVVEERLLSFMEQAEKTEDLLTISDDLATVQGEIDQITGRMKYLQNKSDLATVSIDIRENNVALTGMNGDELNTWEKTKQQFLKSINLIISVLSGLFVFVAGNLPILILLGVIGIIAWWVVRKKRKSLKQES
ncbi:DUF4349 domain-containing protein [Oceanobacillus kapialis]|uniref:DUF4349 domain-containing protein n=1 Tax=Oceanobacillus kapialis TaxID=481353 RepID=A0ABW5Q3H5_9BACI